VTSYPSNDKDGDLTLLILVPMIVENIVGKKPVIRRKLGSCFVKVGILTY